jgi:hypothetical protein
LPGRDDDMFIARFATQLIASCSARESFEARKKFENKHTMTISEGGMSSDRNTKKR